MLKYPNIGVKNPHVYGQWVKWTAWVHPLPRQPPISASGATGAKDASLGWGAATVGIDSKPGEVNPINWLRVEFH